MTQLPPFFRYFEDVLNNEYRCIVREIDRTVANIRLTSIPGIDKLHIPEKYYDSLYVADFNIIKAYRDFGVESNLLQKAKSYSEKAKKPLVLSLEKLPFTGVPKIDLEEFMTFHGFRKIKKNSNYFFYRQTKQKNKGVV